jgi:hypothetical protein
MKIMCDKRNIGIEDVSAQLETLKYLIYLHSDFFRWTKEKVEKESFILTCGYNEHSALVMALSDVLDNALELLEIVQENQSEAVTA